MNETILNGLLNLFAIFASIVKLNNEQATKAIHSYLSSHFGVRSHEEYIQLYNELREVYDDPFFEIDKEGVIKNICQQMKVKLTAQEQLLVLIRFLEFAHTNSEEFHDHLQIFFSVAEIFHISREEFTDALGFVTGVPETSALLVIDSNPEERENHIYREGIDGFIRVFYLRRFDKILFTYHGDSIVFMDDNPLAPKIFYSWQYSSVIKGPLLRPVYYSNLIAVFNKNEQQEKVCLTGVDVDFTFPNSHNGIHNFSFQLETGQLVAIMGGSGVGKSTLLGLMNGNIQPDRGNVTINGYPLTDPDARRLIGFVPQDDLLIEELTVYQNLWFTARLCFDQLSEFELEKKVNTVLQELDLQEIKMLEVGSPIRKTISGGQRKRLNIALELIREPAILYLDEPTSGLSSSDSVKVVTLLKEQTHKGRLVVINIHQPSSEIYKLFDRLWILDKGGYPIYDGNPIEAITYFKHAARYTDENISVCNTCGNVNPELILNIIDSKKIDDSGNQTDIRKFTPEEWHQEYVQTRPEIKEPEKKELPPNQQKKPSPWSQFLIFSERNLLTKLTNKQYLLIALLEAPLLALIVSYLSRYAENGEYNLLTNKNFVSYIFMSVIVVTFIGMSISAEEIIKDRVLLKRERFLRLSRGSYLCSKIAYLFVLSGLQTLLFIAAGNKVIGVGTDMFWIWWSVLWITAFLANLTGLWLSQTLNSVVAIYITIPLLLIPQILLCGLVVHFDDLNTKASEKNIVPLIGEVIPSRWAFEALVVEQYRSNEYNRPFYLIEREKYLAQYYRNMHASEVRDMAVAFIENDSAFFREIIENELTVLCGEARIEPYHSGESYLSYLDKVDEALKVRANNFTAYLEQVQQEIRKEKGQDYLAGLRKQHHNKAIEDLVQGTGNKRMYRKGKKRIYPQIGQIYVKPESSFGRAHFYSGEKKIGNTYFSTYLFNLLVLGFFVLLTIIAIFAEFPGRVMKKRNDY